MSKKKITRKTNKILNIYEDGGDLSTKIGSVGGAVTGALGAAMQNAKLADTSAIENNINSLMSKQFNANNNNDLMNSWRDVSFMNTISASDLTPRVGEQILNTFGAMSSGATSGAKLGNGAGAAIGGAIGLLGGGIGSIIGSVNAKKRAAELNLKNQIATQSIQNAFNQNALNVNKQMNNSMLANYSAFGGDLHTHGGVWSNGVTKINNGNSHENNLMGGVPMGVDQEGTPNLVEEGEVKFNDYMFSNRLFATKELLTNYKLPSSYKNHSFADIAEKLSKESSERPNDPISKRGLLDSMMKLQQAQEEIRAEKQQKEIAMNPQMAQAAQAAERNMFDTGGTLVGSTYNPTLLPDLTFNNPINNRINEKYFEGDNRLNTLNFSNKGINYRSNFNPDNLSQQSIYSQFPMRELSATPQQAFQQEKPKDESWWNNSYLRYAPVLGAGVGALSDAVGWTNEPDFTDADKIEKIGNNITPVSARTLGNYLTYNPLDRNYYANQMNAQANATRNAIINQAGGNSAAAMANMLAADYNATNALGNLARQSEEYNAAQRERVETFNRGTDQFNAEMAFKADLANRERNELMLKALATSAQLRDQAIMRSSGMKAANLTNLFESIGDIGREEFSRNMILSDPSKYYGIDSNGNIFYKNGYDDLSEEAQKEVNVAAIKEYKSNKGNKDKTNKKKL